MANDVKRLNYFDGLFLKAEDFSLEQEYNLRFRRLHNCYMHSPGIVNGLLVKPGSSPAKVIVSKGMALNRVMVDGQEVSQEILLQQDQELDFSKYKPGDNIYITISYQEKPVDLDPLKGEKEFHIQEMAVIDHSLVKPVDPDQALILGRVMPDVGEKGIIIAEKNIFDTDPDGTPLRTGAGTIGKTVQTEKLILDIPGERSNLPNITGAKQDNQNGLQVNSPSTRFSGSITIEGELAVKGTVTTVNTEVLEVKDNIIAVNKYKAQDTPKEINGGLEVFRGGKAPKAQIIWDETQDRWVIGTEDNLVDLAYGSLWDNLTKKALADELHRHSQLATPAGNTALAISPNGNVSINGSLSVTGFFTPSAGNAENKGIMFPKDLGGGGGDGAWLRYYPRAGESCTLELGTSNDPDDHIAFMPSGNVGIGTQNPADRLDVYGNLRILSNSNPIRFTPSWQGFADSADKTKINNAEISNDTSGYKTLMIVGNSSAGLGRRVSIWDRLDVNGSLSVTGNLTPSVGNTEKNGIMFPKDPGGGGGDGAWLRYYPRTGESCTLELGISNDPDDHISLMPSGNVGVKTANPFQPLTVGDRKTGDGQGVMLRVVGDGPASWKGSAAFGNTKATVIMGEINGTAAIGGHNADLTAWADLSINYGGGNVGIGTSQPGAQLHVTNTLAIGPYAIGPGNGRLIVTGPGAEISFSRRDLNVWAASPKAGDRFVWYNPNGTARLWTEEIGDLITVDTSGNVGIGTLTPTDKLTVEGGNIRVRQFPADDKTPSLTALSLVNRAKDGTDLSWSLYTAAVGGGFGVNPNAFEIWEYPATLPRFIIRSGGDTLLAPSSGNVGIKTANPFQPLTVGSRPTGDGQGVMLRVVGDGPASWKGSAAFGHTKATVIMGELNGVATIGGHNADLTAWGNLAINPVGNVGIGTTVPAYKLDVTGSMRVTGPITPSAGNSEGNGIMFPKDPGGGGGDAAWLRYYSRGGESTTFELGTSNDGDDHIALMASGGVGIGTNAPSEKLDVVGNVKVCNNANPIQFNSGHTGFVNGAKNRAEIANDIGDYKTLMLLGNSSAGLGRRVSVWDRLEVNGSFWVNSAQRFDLAEVTPARPEDRLELGDVVVIDPENGLRVKRSVKPGDNLVYGIVSSYEQAAMIIGGPVPGDIAKDEDNIPVALVGRVKAKVSAEAGAIKAGDMLMTSSTPGHLMRCADPSRFSGAVAGKALEAWENGCGMITVLVTLQ